MVKKESGITLIALVVMIMVMLVLVGTAVHVGTNSMDNTKVTAFQSEMQIIQARVDIAYQEIKSGDTYYDNVGKEISSLSPSLQASIRTALQGESSSGFKYFDKEELKKINVEGTKQQVVIHFGKREVVSITGVRKKGNIYYRDDENLNNSRYQVDYQNKNLKGPTFEAKLEPTENGWKIVAYNILYQGHVGEGTLQYKLKEETEWKEAKKNEDSVLVQDPGIYQVKLVDSAGNESSTKELYAYVKSGLVIYYDGVSNTRAGHNTRATQWQDLSGNQNDISLTGFNYTSTSGWGTDYLRLDGVDDYLVRTNPMYDKVGGTPDLHVEVISSKDNLVYGSLLSFGKYTNVNSYMDLWTTSQSTRIYQVSYTNNRLDSEVITKSCSMTSSEYPLNTYHSVSYGKEGNRAYTYLDGVKKDEQDAPKYTGWQTNKLYIGRDEKAADGNGNFVSGKYYYFKGNIKSVRIYNRALTENEIAINTKIDRAKGLIP